MINLKNGWRGLQDFLLLWSTQSLSILGSSMTSFTLIIWSYKQTGSALSTALLSICTYAPYVVLSIFAGSLADRWDKKKIMLVCDTFAAMSTLCILMLYQTQQLAIWHVYVLNIWNGIMDTLQQPASDVAVTLLASKEQYQRVGSLRSFANSLNTMLSPILATAIMGFFGMEMVFYLDLISFGIAFIMLLGFIKIPAIISTEQKESIMKSTKQALGYLKEHRGIFDLILFLAAINLCASIYNAALPAMILSKHAGGDKILAIMQTCTGLANVAGSIVMLFMKAPKSRVRVICNALLFSMSTENFLLAFGRIPEVYYLGAMLGWLMIPLMNTNLDVILRSHIPLAMQGRVYAARNSLQFFTIPLGYLVGGVLVDYVFEPWMRSMDGHSRLVQIFGSGKGSGAALLFFFLAILGILVCLLFRRDHYIWDLEKED